MERLFRSAQRQQQQQQQQVDPAALKKRLKMLCAFSVAAGEHSGPAAAIKEESRGYLDVRRDENGVRYALHKLDRGSILAAKAAESYGPAVAAVRAAWRCHTAGAAIGRSCTQAWPPSIIFLGTIVFQALGNRASPSPRAMWAVPFP
jgi:hypothetical protein